MKDLIRGKQVKIVALNRKKATMRLQKDALLMTMVIFCATFDFKGFL